MSLWLIGFALCMISIASAIAWNEGPYRGNDRVIWGILVCSVVAAIAVLWPLGIAKLPIGFALLAGLGVLGAAVIFCICGLLVGEGWKTRYLERRVNLLQEEEENAERLYASCKRYWSKGYKVFLVDKNKIAVPVEFNSNITPTDLHRWWTGKQKEGNILQWRNGEEIVIGQHWTR